MIAAFDPRSRRSIFTVRVKLGRLCRGAAEADRLFLATVFWEKDDCEGRLSATKTGRFRFGGFGSRHNLRNWTMRSGSLCIACIHTTADHRDARRPPLPRDGSSDAPAGLSLV